MPLSDANESPTAVLAGFQLTRPKVFKEADRQALGANYSRFRTVGRDQCFLSRNRRQNLVLRQVEIEDLLTRLDSSSHFALQMKLNERNSGMFDQFTF